MEPGVNKYIGSWLTTVVEYDDAITFDEGLY